MLEQLSLIAHERAMSTGTLTPAERPEFSHLRMKISVGIPVLDAGRMRYDQIADAEQVLRRMIGTYRPQNARARVLAYVESYGRFGLRKQDIADALMVDEKSVRNALRPLIAEGRVRVVHERTRGDGSRRQRYFWQGELPDYRAVPDTSDDGLYEMRDQVSNGDTGVRYHGTAVQGVTCRCPRCTDAFDSAIFGEIESAERQAGGTGFFAGLELRRTREMRAQRQFERALEQSGWDSDA